ncbi:MAG: response regulator, partial [Planctomycetales bacterium]|nr:response regulator [Planctomycetales bacterium]
ESWRPDLVLLDINMPGIDGYETCLRLKSSGACPAPQVVVVSANSTKAEMTRGYEVGADDYLVKPVDPCELRARVELHFRLCDSRAATERLQRDIENNHCALRQSASERREQVLAAQDVAVFTLAKVAESRDNDTGQHCVRIREYSQRLAHELRYSPYFSLIDEEFL